MVAFEQGIRPLMEIVLPDKAEAVISFRGDPNVQSRIEELAQKYFEIHKLMTLPGETLFVDLGSALQTPLSDVIPKFNAISIRRIHSEEQRRPHSD